jgi:hypothetical protein
MQRRLLGVLLAIIASLIAVSCDETEEAPSPVVEGTIDLEHGVVEALERFEFATDLHVSAADGDYSLTFEGAFEQPDRLQGTLRLADKFEEVTEVYDRPAEAEVVIIGTHVWWREDGEWQPGIEEGYERIDPFVAFRQYATPWFYLDALFFDTLSLPVAGEPEEIDGVRSVHVHLDKQGVIDVLRQGQDIYVYPDEPHTPEAAGVSTGVIENAQQVLPRDFNVDVWFAEDGLYPTRILFDYAVDEEDSSGLAFGFERPMTLHLQMDITDPAAEAAIEAPTPIPTVVPTPSLPTPEPGQPGVIPTLTAEDEARIQEIALASPYVQELLAVAGEYETPEPFFVWHSFAGEKLGGGFFIEFSELAEYENDWPEVVYDESEQTSPPFRMTTTRYRVENLSRVRVLVYLPGEVLVEITPEDGTRVPP